jgi:hypothetical protein
MDLLTTTFKIDTSILFYLPLLLSSQVAQNSSTTLLFDSRKDFLFIGNFLHEPNWNAVQYLKENDLATD